MLHNSVDGGWSPWREDAPCSMSCGGGGVRVLVRDCNNPAPANDGKECEGEDWMLDTTCADCPCETCNLMISLYSIQLVLNDILYCMTFKHSLIDVKRMTACCALI